MKAGIVYYTDGKIGEPIRSWVRERLAQVGLPIVSVSLQPLDFGEVQVCWPGRPSVITMFRQILAGLEACPAATVFLCEHDVLYHPSHFDFRSPRDDVYYYNTHVWRWRYPDNYLITYDHLVSLSGLCANRDLLTNHYRRRLEFIEEMGWPDGRDPGWARKIGYEPGKPVHHGGVLDEIREEWRSPVANIDIRHGGTLTPGKTSLDSFRRQPTGWREAAWEDIEGWEDWCTQRRKGAEE